MYLTVQAHTKYPVHVFSITIFLFVNMTHIIGRLSILEDTLWSGYSVLLIWNLGAKTIPASRDIVLMNVRSNQYTTL